MKHQYGFAAFGFLFLLIGIGFSIGWIAAHGQVAGECKLMGAFYVGDTVYQCEVKKR